MHAESTNYLAEAGSGRGTPPRSLACISGAIPSHMAPSCAAGARLSSSRAIARGVTARLVKASINESLRGLPGPSETDAPVLRSAGRRESSWGSQCIGGKAGPGISATSASTAARSCPQPRRSTSTSGDALPGRSQTLSNLLNENGRSRKALSQPSRSPEATWRCDDIKVLSLK